MHWDNLISRWREHCTAAHLSPATVRLRSHYLGRLATDHPDPAAITSDDLVRWIAEHDWSAETARAARATLRGFFSWAVEWGHLPSDPARLLPPVRVPQARPRPAPSVVVRRALESSSERDALMVALAAWAGLRRGEIARLRWDDVSAVDLAVRGKGGKDRRVPLLPALADRLERERRLRAAGSSGSGWRFRVDPRSPFVFPGLRGGHMSVETVGAVLAAVLGDGWTGHTLRHRFGTRAYAAGGRDLRAVQQLLGHSSPVTTQVYVGVEDDALVSAVAGAAVWESAA